MFRKSILLLSAALLLSSCDNSEKDTGSASSSWRFTEKKDPLTDATKTTAATQVTSEQFTAQVEMSCSVHTSKAPEFEMAVSFFDNEKKGVEFKRQVVPGLGNDSMPDVGANVNVRFGSVPMEKLFISYDKLPYSNGVKMCWTSKEVGGNQFLGLALAIQMGAENLAGRGHSCLSDKSLEAMGVSKTFVVNPELGSGSPTFIIDYTAAEPQRVLNSCRAFFSVAKPSSAEQKPEADPSEQPQAAASMSQTDIDACLVKKMDAYRQEKGEDAAISQDMTSEWQEECRIQ